MPINPSTATKEVEDRPSSTQTLVTKKVTFDDEIQTITNPQERIYLPTPDIDVFHDVGEVLQEDTPFQDDDTSIVLDTTEDATHQSITATQSHQYMDPQIPEDEDNTRDLVQIPGTTFPEQEEEALPRRTPRNVDRVNYAELNRRGRRANMLVLEYHSEQAPEQDIHEKPTQVLVFTSIKAEELRNYGSVAIPKNYFEAQKHSDFLTRWLPAMQKQVQDLLQRQVWTSVLPPKGAEILDGRWVYDMKFPENADPMARSRWVARQ